MGKIVRFGMILTCGVILVACGSNNKKDSASSLSTSETSKTKESTESPEEKRDKENIEIVSNLILESENTPNRDTYNKANEKMKELNISNQTLTVRLNNVYKTIEDNENAQAEEAQRIAAEEAQIAEANRQATLEAEQAAISEEPEIDYAYDATNGEIIDRPNDPQSVQARKNWYNDQLEWAKQNGY